MTSEPEYFDTFDGDQDEGFSIPPQLREPIGVLRRQSRWVLATLSLLLLATIAGTIYFPLQYEARATILLTSKSIPDQYVPSTIVTTILEQFEAIYGTVFSRASLGRIVSETGIYDEDADTMTLDLLAARLGKELLVNPISNGSFAGGASHSVTFEVKMKGKHPEMLAEVVNKVIAKLIDENIEYRDRQARVTTRFMQKEFDRADEALRNHQRKLVQFRAENRGSLPEEQTATLAKLERLEEQRKTSILQTSDLEARLQRIRSRPEGEAVDGTFDALLARLAQAKTLYTAEHPTVQSLERQVAQFDHTSAPDTSSASLRSNEEQSMIEKDIGLARIRLAQIEESVKNLEANIALGPKISEEYSALVREDKILQENYVEYLRKLKNAELSLSLETSQQGVQLSRLDPALPPASPIIPRWLVAAAGVVAALGLAVLTGLAREFFLYPVIIDEAHLEDAIPTACLGSVSEVA